MQNAEMTGTDTGGVIAAAQVALHRPARNRVPEHGLEWARIDAGAAGDAQAPVNGPRTGPG